jgi:hypothetical protein
MFDDLTPEEKADLESDARQLLHELLAVIAADSSVLAEVLLNEYYDDCVAAAGGDRRHWRKVYEAAGINRQFVAEQLDFYAGRYLKAVEEGREGDHTDANAGRILFNPTCHAAALRFDARLEAGAAQ